MLKEYSIRNDESNFPVCLLDTFCKRLITQTRPTLYESSHFFRCMFPVVTNWAGTYQDSSDAITFYIIIDPVACRYRKEFHTRERLIEEIEKMENEGIICGYPTLINWDKTDTEKVTAFIEVRVTPQRGQGFEKLAERITNYPEVKSIRSFQH